MRSLVLCLALTLTAGAARAETHTYRAITDEECQARAGRLMQIMRSRRVVYDPKGFWKCTGANLNRLARHITLEEFRNKDPVRSGREVELYKKIKSFATSRKPGESLDMGKLLELGLDATAGEDGTVNYQLAMLTIHNVVRILARPKVWPETPAAADPAQPIFLDLRGTAAIGGSKTLPDLLGVRRNVMNPGDWALDTLFDIKGGPFQAQPGAEKTEWNGGCHYYYWIGALARTTMGQGAILAGVMGEALGKKPDQTGFTAIDQKVKEILVDPTQQGVVELAQFICGSNFGSAAFAARKEMEGTSACPSREKGDRLWLVERDFAVYDDKTKQLVPGRKGETPTSLWMVSDGAFQFGSRKDGFKLNVQWDAPPARLDALDPFVMTITATIEGEREAAVALTPVMQIAIWRVKLKDASEGVERSGPNAYRMKLGPDRKKAHMQLEITAVGQDAKVVDGEVVGGNGKLFVGRKPDEFDAFFLELQLNGMAMARWTWVPSGSPHIKTPKGPRGNN